MAGGTSNASAPDVKRYFLAGHMLCALSDTHFLIIQNNACKYPQWFWADMLTLTGRHESIRKNESRAKASKAKVSKP